MRWYTFAQMHRSVSLTVLLLALAFPAPATAGDPSDATANYAGVATLGAPVEADGRPKGAGVPTPWGVLDLSIGSTPQSLPFRLQLSPRTESSSPAPAPSLVPYLSLGRTEMWNDELPETLRNLGDDGTGRLKTGAGLIWSLNPNAEITGEYQFMGIQRPGLSLRPSAIDRALDTGLDVLEFSLNLSIRY